LALGVACVIQKIAPHPPTVVGIYEKAFVEKSDVNRAHLPIQPVALLTVVQRRSISGEWPALPPFATPDEWAAHVEYAPPSTLASHWTW
jgi:hypothetical protein